MVTVWETLAGPLLYAHRGAGLEHPENSLEAFEAALAAGADVLEADVHLSRDGHVIVSHDPSGARVAGEAGEIRRSTLLEIKRWDLARAQPKSAQRGAVRMPTLDEVLRAFPSALLNLDVKQREPDMTRALLQTIARHTAEPRVLLTSFEAAITRRLRALRYAGPTGLARAEVAAALFAPSPLARLLAPRGTRMQIPIRAGVLPLAHAAVVRRAHARGLAVDYWVVNDLALAEHLLALGADGIVTDDPRAMARLFAHAPSTAGWRARHAAL